MSGYGVPAPRPENDAAMVAAYASGDKVEIAKQLAIYNRQLIAGGYPPLYVQLDVPDITEPRGTDRA